MPGRVGSTDATNIDVAGTAGSTALTSFVARVDWDRVATPSPSSATAHGLARAVVVGPEQGAVHTEIAIGSLQAGGWIARHFHSFEESLYVLGGELLLEVDGT